MARPLVDVAPGAGAPRTGGEATAAAARSAGAADAAAAADAAEAAEAAEAERLAEVYRLDLLDSPPEARFDRLTELAAQVFGVPTVQLNLIDRDRQWSKAQYGSGEREVDRSVAFCDTTIRREDGLVVEDASADPQWRDNRLVTGESHIRFYAGHPLYGPGGHAIGALCLVDTEARTFSEAERATLRSLARYAEREINHHDELQRAGDVQRSLWPASGLQVPGFEVAGTCLPAHGVGGDFFDWYLVGDRLVVTVADVMGKGLPAAILAATARAVLRSETRRGGAAESLTAAGEVLGADLEATGAFVTAFHSVVHPDGRLEFADAGHGLALLVRADTELGVVEPLEPRGLPLGVLAGDQALGGTRQLEPGDTLVVLSDGVLDLVESMGFGIRLIGEAVRRASSADEVVEAVTRFAADKPRPDDVTVVAVRRTRS